MKRQKMYVKLVLVTAASFALILISQAFYFHSTKKKENILVHKPKSLIPFSQNWAQMQFQHTLSLMGKEYSTVQMWSKCRGYTKYYENIKF